MLRFNLAVISALGTLAACQQPVESAPPSRAPAAVAVGEPVDCVQTSRIDNTRVYDDSTIDFEMIDGTRYRNTLPVRCNGLGFEERFSYRTTIGRLCDLDTITVIRSGGPDGPTCGLGDFVPVQLVEN